MPDDRRVLEGVARMVVDGSNVLHALQRSPAPVPATALVGRLRAMVPAAVAITVVLDGSPEHGLVARHIAAGVEVRYAGRTTADEFIVRLLDTPSRHQPAETLVITDDVELSNAVRRSGARTARTGWLVNKLERQRLSAPSPGRPGLAPPVAPSIGRGKRPTPASSAGDPGAGSATGDEDADALRWKPGRGATRKRGNGRRRPAGDR